MVYVTEAELCLMEIAMPRPRQNTRKTNIMLDRDIHDKLHLLLQDPRTNRMRYGALGSVVNGLLRKLLDHLDKSDTDTVAVLEAYGVKFNKD